MQKSIDLSLAPEVALDPQKLQEAISKKIKTTDFTYQILKQSIDARKKEVKVHLNIQVFINEPLVKPIENTFNYPPLSTNPKQAIIVGAGPAGLFAALRLLELGVKPIVFERGSDVKERRRDLANINKNLGVNPESNYCFGEGGAGTYSDGKLYTRSKKRGDLRRILELLVAHGATEKILYEAHPHIGTNKLPKVVESIREKIIAQGGEIHFNKKVIDFALEKNKIIGVEIEGQGFVGANAVILATGHSARDIYYLLAKKHIKIEAKPFALGVRIEHPQKFVDNCQYSNQERGLLPAASYSLVSQTHYKGVKRGVFSFCMCPGGFIVPASTSQKELVVNGMSPSKRDSPYANSGIVVAINEPDWQIFADYGDLAALKFQEHIETKAWEAVNSEPNSMKAPAQRIPDFLARRKSETLNETSYQPGLVSSNFHDILPTFIAESLMQGISFFNKKMRNYGQNHGQLIGIESRTSSPVRIPRNKENLEHLEISGLYPCGEGAGYAGGIISAAMDGERCAESLAKTLK